MESHIRSKRSSMHGLAIVLAGVWLSAAWEPARLQAAAEDWQSRIRQLVQEQQLADALAIAETRLGAQSEDLEARGWRARLLAWTNRWHESEIEYRAVLHFAPHDTDILVGLADLLSWQGRRAEAIVLLDQAIVLDAGRNDVQLRRGRLLHALGRRAEAGAAYALVFSLKGLFVGMEDGLARPATEFFVKITKASRSLRSVELRLESTVEWDTLRFAGTPAIPVKATYRSFALADTRRRAMG